MKFLGFGFFKDYKVIYTKQNHTTNHLDTFKFKLKQLTRKNWNVDTKYQIDE